MILTAHQPVYLPWLGLFHKIALCERYCVLDVAQYQVNDVNNRNKIKTHDGPLWLTVPVESRNHLRRQIRDARIASHGWERKHVASMRMAYARAPYLNEYLPPIEAILAKRHAFLTELNTELLVLFMRLLDLERPVVFASDLDPAGAKSLLLLDLCAKLGADRFVFGALGREYADLTAFEAAGVTPYFQAYRHPEYRQRHGPFVPYLSIVDLLFNEGPRSRDIVLAGNATRADVRGLSSES
jgi:hypothetical protein